MAIATIKTTTEQPGIRPEFFRLPKPGTVGRKATPGKPARPAKPAQCDPYFGFSRSYYYEGEKRGYWKLIRIRDDGKDRGVTLVPYAAVAALVRSQIEAAK